MSSKGIDTYCPLRKTLRQWSDRKKMVSEPLFTSYVFVRVEEAERWRVLEDPGALQFVFWLGQPAIIQDREIENIKQFLADHPLASAETLSVQVGDRVKVVAGPLKGQTGIVKDEQSNRIFMRLEQIGYELVAELHKNKLTRV